MTTPDDRKLVQRAADKLERILNNCTPGPWRRGGYGNYGWAVSADNPDSNDAFSVEVSDSEQGKADAEYLETMNPEVGREILVLLQSYAAGHTSDSHAFYIAQAILDQREADR